MFGKLFASLYTGSMVGAGPVPFALMPYIIANAVPDSRVGAHVELNPKILSTIIGTTEKAIEEAIEYLCRPDPKSRTPDEEGRRLVRLGPYDYRVVNYARYRRIRDQEERREQNRRAQAVYREKKRQVRDGEEGVKLLRKGDQEMNEWDVEHSISRPGKKVDEVSEEERMLLEQFEEIRRLSGQAGDTLGGSTM